MDIQAMYQELFDNRLKVFKFLVTHRQQLGLYSDYPVVAKIAVEVTTILSEDSEA